MKFKKVCSILLSAVMLCSLFATPVYATPKEDKEKALAEQAALEEEKKEAESEKAALQQELNTLMTEINALEIKLMDKGMEIVQAEEDLAEAEEKEEDQAVAMAYRIKYMYESESGDFDMLKSIFEADSLSDMLAQLEYVQQVHEYDRMQLEAYAETVEEVKNLKSTLEDEMEVLQEMEVEYQKQSDALNTMIVEKSSEIDGLSDMIQIAAQAAIEAAEREEAEKRAAAAAEAARQEAARQEAARQEAANNAGSGSSGSTSTPEPSYDVVTGNAIVDRAYSWVGRAEYVWGGCAPGQFDCSGFVSYCLTGQYTRLGTTYTFLTWPQVSNPQPGDVCVNSGHCGIYIGGGQMIHAATYDVGVIVGAVQSGMIYVRY